VFTPRWNGDGESGSAAKGRTVAVYEVSPGKLPDLTLGTDQRHVVPGPSLKDSWNANSGFAVRGYRPIVVNLPDDDSDQPGDYIFVRFKSKAGAAVLLRTRKLLEIDDRDDWDTTASAASDGERVFQQGPVLPSADMGVVQASGGHVRTVFYAGGDKNSQLWKFSGAEPRRVRRLGERVPKASGDVVPKLLGSAIAGVLQRGARRSFRGGGRREHTTLPARR
jgi:hypothetical protein